MENRQSGRQDVVSKILERLSNIPLHACKIDSEDLDINMKDGNVFTCLGVSANCGDIEIRCWYEFTDEFYVSSKHVTEQTLWDIYNAMPSERTIYIGFVDGINQAGKTYTIGITKTFVSDEEIIEELTKFMPGTKWDVDDDGQYVCYALPDKKQYFLAEVCAGD